MNKFRKILVGVVVAAGVGCLAGAVGCSEPDYYKLTFEGQGLDYVFEGALAPESGEMFINGYGVRSGVEVRFTLALGADTVGTPEILLNGSVIEPDANGVYSFIMERESTVSVNGLQQKERVTFNSGDWHSFYDQDGNLLNGEVPIVKGETFKFKLWVSPYYKDTYTVTNDTEELTPDKDGYYEITGAKSTVNVEKLVMEDSFLVRGEGDGTEENPFILRKPVDLFEMAARVNDDFYTSYSFAHYKLAEDIDMKGEKLFVIGDYSNSEAIFCGTFDGDGHTISNFSITDEVIDQSTFIKEYLQYVGLFGYACATTTNGPAVIKNLTLKDYEVTVHPALSAQGKGTYAGSVLGLGIGVQIEGVNCENGTIVSNNDNKNMSYLGGVVGYLQSAYNNSLAGVITYNAYVNGCYTDVEVKGTGAIYFAGGIAGILATADTSAISYVTNCVSTGSVSGAMYAGGVVGSLSRFSSVGNCYTSAAVSANNSMIGAGISTTYKRACAGGIVGYAENDSVVSGCYVANASYLKATSASNLQNTDAIVGFSDEALTDGADSEKFLSFNCHKKSDGDTADIYTATLGWNADEWELSGSLPAYKGASQRTVTLTYKNGDSQVGSYEKSISVPVPVCAWYADGLDEFVTSSDKRSWGYYFDKELTQKVPYGYLPSADCTLYVGFADYSEVAGTYFMGASQYGNDAHFTLDAEGGVLFRDGGMNLASAYSYDGNKITLYNSCLGALVYSVDQISGSYATVVMEKSGDGYNLTGKIFVASADSDGNVSYSLGDIALTAQRQAEGFTYGEYVNGNGNLLVFRKNGTGTFTANNQSQSFTFTYTDGELTLSNGLPVEVTDGKVTAFNRSSASLKDGFAGIWKTNANSLGAYEFDGAGTVKYGGITGEYVEVAEGQVLLTLGDKTVGAKFSADGALFIDGTAYYLSDGFTGSWYGRLVGDDSSDETAEITLGGIGLNGYGEAEITYYCGVIKNVVGQYSVLQDGTMRVYVEDVLYGEIKLNASTGVASGGFLSYQDYLTLGYMNYKQVDFKLYDLFKGVWVCDVEDIASVNFTGKGGEDGGAEALVTGANGRVTNAIYSVTTANTGVLTLNGKEYALTLDELGGKIALELNQTSAGSLAHRDAWYGVTLYDGETAYTFNGNGNLVGAVAVSDGTTYSYTVGADGLPVIDGAPLTAEASGFGWNGKTLSFKTGFADTWVVPVTNAEITVSEIKSDLTATVVMDGKTYNFIYNPSYNTLTYTEADAKGATTTTVLSLSGNLSKGVELAVNVKGSQNADYVCVSKSGLDKWAGKYVAEDGSSWTFDGLGASKYGSGTATHISANGKKTTYDYMQNQLGMVFIRTGVNVGMVFAETASGGYKKEGSQTGYSPVTADAMYLLEARLDNVYLVFDGAGRLWKNVDGAYEKYGNASYKHMTSGISRSYCVVDINGDGNKSLATREALGGTAVLTLGEYVEWTLVENGVATDKKYVFDPLNGLWLIQGEGYVMAYEYTKLSTDNSYGLDEYGVADGKAYIMTLKQSDHTFTLKEIENNED